MSARDVGRETGRAATDVPVRSPRPRVLSGPRKRGEMRKAEKEAEAETAETEGDKAHPPLPPWRPIDSRPRRPPSPSILSRMLRWARKAHPGLSNFPRSASGARMPVIVLRNVAGRQQTRRFTVLMIANESYDHDYHDHIHPPTTTTTSTTTTTRRPQVARPTAHRALNATPTVRVSSFREGCTATANLEAGENAVPANAGDQPASATCVAQCKRQRQCRDAFVTTSPVPMPTSSTP